MVRHGQSEMNKDNKFTGWIDSNLTERGVKEAKIAGQVLKDLDCKFDVAYGSILSRSLDTLNIIFDVMDQTVPIYSSWRLNERHYGALTSLSKEDCAKKFGIQRVDTWRRGYRDVPPPMTKNHPWYCQITCDKRYRFDPKRSKIPSTESLKMCIERTLPYWVNTIVPSLKEGKKVLICSHGNTLRGIVKHLDNLNEEEVLKFHIPTAIPFSYELDRNMKPMINGRMRYMGDPEYIENALKEVKVLSAFHPNKK